MSAYICSPDNSYGMHKCRDLPRYKAGNTQMNRTYQPVFSKRNILGFLPSGDHKTTKLYFQLHCPLSLPFSVLGKFVWFNKLPKKYKYIFAKH